MSLLLEYNERLKRVRIGTNVNPLPTILKDKFLFFGQTKKISDGKLMNELGTDWLTVNDGNYQCPNTAPYIAADTDKIWFQVDDVQRIVSTAELIGYDFKRTPIKYDDNEPHTIRYIAIMKADAVFTADELNVLFKVFELPIEWNNDTNGFGHIKANRIGQSVWIPSFNVIAEYESVYNAMTVKPSWQDKWIQNVMLKSLVDGGYYSKAEVLDVFATHSANEGLFNWRNVSVHNPTKVISPLFSQYKGYKGANSNGSCIDKNFIPNIDKTVITDTSMTVLLAVLDEVSENFKDFGRASYADNKNIYINSRVNSSNRTDVNVMAAAGVRYEGITSSIAHVAASRVDNVNHHVYRNKAAKVTSARVSTGLPSTSMVVCGCDENGVKIGSNKTIPYCFIFSGLTDAEIWGVMDIMDNYLKKYNNGIL